ncbi:MAG TPA: LLM class F420-dependent oxidoreductase [Actinomycetota bacterium]|nr:LLM class F420-dependent oxidoreductase [Actinomycetota bacterium]
MGLPIGIEIPYTDLQDRPGLIALAREAEDLEYDCIWCSEVYTYDAFTTLTQIACETSTIKVGTNIAQIYARTPSLLATTAASLDQLSGGRFILGIGASGPQVVEGWHGVPYDRPVQRTREIIEIARTVWSGARVTHDGPIYRLSKGLKLLNNGHRTDIPIYVAALGPKNVEMTAEIADGWLPFPFSSEHARAVFDEPIKAGLSKRSSDRGPFHVAPFAPVFVGDTSQGLNAARMIVGFYIGGMGSKQKNFYNQLVQRYGFVEEATKVQEMFLGGDKAGAIAATPDDLVDQVSIVGDVERTRDRLQAFAEAGATELVVSFLGDAPQRSEMMRALARANA